VASVAESVKAPPELVKVPSFVDWKTRSCPVCWRKWGRALLPGRCICTGDVKVGTQYPRTAIELVGDLVKEVVPPATAPSSSPL
jgi:hypothetical protein